MNQIGYSSRRPQWVPLLPAKNRKLRLVHTGLTKIRQEKIRKSLSGPTSLIMSAAPFQMAGSEFGVNNMKASIHPTLCYSSGFCCCWWWCNGVGDNVLADFGTLSANWASSKPTAWLCTSADHNYSVLDTVCPSSDSSLHNGGFSIVQLTQENQ